MFGISDVVRRRAIAAGFVVAVVIAAMSAWRGPTQPYESLWPGAANLRAQFNADAGKVRILLLPAPT
jgi:hypothetical protein